MRKSWFNFLKYFNLNFANGSSAYWKNITISRVLLYFILYMSIILKVRRYRRSQNFNKYCFEKLTREKWPPVHKNWTQNEENKMFMHLYVVFKWYFQNDKDLHKWVDSKYCHILHNKWMIRYGRKNVHCVRDT